MQKSNSLGTIQIQSLIFKIRNTRVMIDADLAQVYGTSTKRLNEQVKRNNNRFPPDFMFRLTEDEKKGLVATCDRFKNLKHSSSLPNAFTEYGALMVANILSSSLAIDASIAIVRAFSQLRQIMSTSEEFKLEFEKIERRFADHDQKLKTVFNAIRQIMNPIYDVKPKRPIGIKP